MWTKRSIITPPLHYSIPVSLAASGDLREIIGRPLKLVVVASEFGPDSWRNRISHDDRMFPSPDSIRTSMRPARYLEDNNFTGSVPESFVSLHHLSNLSIKCNPHLDSQLPPGLLRRNLTISSGNCLRKNASETSSSQRSIYLLGAGGSLAFSLAFAICFNCFYKRAHHSDRRDHLDIKSMSEFLSSH
ncbi:hypothetical protein BHE74_00026661 [Ensete ventricosum]|nr:hypothetical protein BHE74_00026661 [Ensete ventricosum]